ncbi:MAG: hypothetical protein J6V17_00300 [Bacteroidales bacterium]|nr:hypothetical protein [Bacteroidales bacterium]
MTEFLIYQGKAAVILAVFYMFYRLLLSKDTFHRFNRIVLLGTAALSFVLPLCVITIHEVVTISAPSPVPEMSEGMSADTFTAIPEVAVPWWTTALTIIFALGAAVVLATSMISIAKVMGIIRSGEHKALESGETLVITDSDTAPFSWMKYIVLSRKDYESGYSQILTHEKAHIVLRHSWDILFTDLVTALQWFNPAIWMLKADLRAIHEFEADDAVLRSGANVKEYQYLLIRKAVSKSGYSVANSFNHSTLKQRITMMSNKKSSRMSVWKALYVIPLVGISLAATAETKVDYLYEDQQPVAVADTLSDKDSENWYKIESVKGASKEMSTFTQKNLYDGCLIVDEDKGTLTLISYDKNGNEHNLTYTGVNVNENIYLVNGLMVSEDLFNKAMQQHDDAVLINSYLKNGKKARAGVYPTDTTLDGTINIDDMRAKDLKIERDGEEIVNTTNKVFIMNREGEGADTDDILFVINGEKMPEDFNLDSIDPQTIKSMEVLKTEDALKQYGAEGKEGVIRITLKDVEE